MKAIDKDNAEHYQWGNNCEGWHLLKSDNLSVIQEVMSPKTSEVLHYHNISQQFFFILKGIATFEVEGEILKIKEMNGLHIKPKLRHKIINNSNENLEFLVVSEPKSHGDRINLE